jgi:rRNA-processing protein FCF1
MIQTSNKKRPVKVIVDSNALFVPLQFKIDIFSELQKLLNRNFQIVLISPVKHELENLVKRGSIKMRKQASFALEISNKLICLEIPEKSKEEVDDAIVRASKALNAIVFTNDKLLKKKLRDISTPVVYVREKSRLEIDGLIS